MKKLFAALAATLVLSTSAWAGDFSMASGTENGGYHKKVTRIAHAIDSEQVKMNKKLRKKGKEPVDFDTEVVVTNGSIENGEGLQDGTFQAAMLQIDELNINKPAFKFKTRTTHSEPVLWLYNEKHGFKDIDSVEGRKDFAIVLVEGSGGNVTFNSFIQEDEDYGKNPTVMAMDLDDALDIVAEGEYQDETTVKVAGMIYVSNSLPRDTVAEYSKYVKVGEATDGDFNDATDVEGNKLYTNCTVNMKKMGGLKGSNKFTDIDTVCVKSVFLWKTQDLSRMEAKVISKAVRSVIK